MTSPVLHDFYSKDDGGHPNIAALLAAGAPWAGAFLKATEGTYYSSGAWLSKMWSEVGAVGARYGVDWFRSAYHYFRVDEDPVKQADFFLKTIDAAGGWGPGDLWPIVDVERSEQPKNATAIQVIDGVSAFAQRIKAAHGRAPVLYAGSYLRDLGIEDHLDCQYLITAAYGSTLPSRLYTSMGWSIDQLFGWQYQGTEGFTGPHGYPQTSPAGAGPQDLTAITIGGTTPEDQLAWIRAHRGA